MADPTRTPTRLLNTRDLPPRTRLAAHGYLARYSGNTLKTYTTSLDLYFRWMLAHGVDPLDARRPQIELYIHQHLELDRGCSPQSVHHHATPIRGFYRFAVVDDFITRDPSLALNLPKVWRDQWRDDWLNAAELRAFIAAARRSAYPSDQGLVALLALLGFRIAETLAVQIEDYQDVLMGHRVIRVIGKGGKPATLPLTVALLRMLDAAAAGRTSGPLLIREHSSVHAHVGTTFTYRTARCALDRLAKDAGITRRVTPHMFRRGMVTSALDQGIPIRDVQIAARHEDPRTTARYDRGAQNLDRSAIHHISAALAGG